MVPSLVQKILVEEFQAEASDGIYKISSDREVVVLVQHDGGILQIGKVAQIAFFSDDAYLSVLNEEGQCTYLDASSVFGLRGQDPEKEPETRPGFRK